MSRIDSIHSDLNRISQIRTIVEQALFDARVKCAALCEQMEIADGAKIDRELDSQLGPRGPVNDALNDALYDTTASLKEEADEHEYHVESRTAKWLAAE